MNLELDFAPDTVVYLNFDDKSSISCNVWGDEEVYLNANQYILKLCNGKSSFIALQKGLGKIKVFHYTKECHV